MSKDSCVSTEKYDEVKWRAESLVVDAMKGTPKFKRAVNQTYKVLKKQETEVKKTVLGTQK